MTTSQVTNSHPPTDQDAALDPVFESFRRVRAAVQDLLAAVGADPNKTRESARALGLSRQLTWRLSRVVRATEPTEILSDMPARVGMTRFIAACRRRGAPSESVREAVDAVEAFERAVDVCSGDRKTLGMLIANRIEPGALNSQERARRQLFEGASSFWGVQAQLRFVTVFVFPSPDDPEMLDAGHVTGYLGFRRLGMRSWPLAYEAVHRATGQAAPFVKEPLQEEPGADEAQRQLLREFCSPSHPPLEVLVVGDMKRFTLPPGPLGNEGLTTCVFGSRLRRLYPRSPAAPDTAGFLLLLHTPVERVVFDMFVHRDLGVHTPPRTRLLDRLTYSHAPVESEFERQSLPLSESDSPLPPGLPGAVCAHIPWYPRLLRYVCERIAQPFEAFVGSRFEMTYPPISTTLDRRFPLGAKERGPDSGAAGRAALSGGGSAER